MLDDLPPFMTVEQAAKVLQLGRSKTYGLTVEWDRTGGKSGLPFILARSPKAGTPCRPGPVHRTGSQSCRLRARAPTSRKPRLHRIEDCRSRLIHPPNRSATSTPMHRW